jgi:molybdate transport system substrate-binding protein
VSKEASSKPNVTSVEGFKKALLDAKSLGYSDPSGGSSSGKYASEVVRRLGIDDAVKPKTRLMPGGEALNEAISQGQIELGILPISEIIGQKGVQLVGPLPPQLQNFTEYAGGVGSKAKDANASKALLDHLASPTSIEVLRRLGIEPGQKAVGGADRR